MAKAAIYYFSATGNTRRGVDIVASRLREAGWELELVGIEGDGPAPRSPRSRRDGSGARGSGERDSAGGGRALPELTILAFPVLAWAPPVFVQRYIRTMPRGLQGRDGRRSRAAVFATWGGAPEGAIALAARALRRRGYSVEQSGGALYPSNWTQMESCADEELSAPINRGGDAMAAAFAETLVAGGPALYRRPPLALAWSRIAALGFDLVGRRVLGKLFVADSSCSSCGLCARICPVGAIAMADGGRRPRWSSACESCNRCINACPSRSIQSSGFRALFHGSLQVLCALGAFIAAGAAARAAGAAGAGAAARTFAYIAAFAATAGAGLLLGLGPLDALAFRLEGRREGRLREAGYSKSFVRRLAPGFAPAAERKAAGTACGAGAR